MIWSGAKSTTSLGHTQVASRLTHSNRGMTSSGDGSGGVVGREARRTEGVVDCGGDEDNRRTGSLTLGRALLGGKSRTHETG